MELNLFEKRGNRGLNSSIVGGLPVLLADRLKDQPGIAHLFTTRLGGVSQGDCFSMNFSLKSTDSPENVLENYGLVAKALGQKPEDIVSTVQTHTTNIRVVTTRDCGKGVTCPVDYTDVDALITNEKSVVLTVFTADCIPILFYDPVKEVIASAHCGWRGTIGELQRKVVDRMTSEYGSKPSDVIAAMGPGICRDCYEISEDVARPFLNLSENNKNFLKEYAQEVLYDTTMGSAELIIPGKEEGKYYLDLWLANGLLLRKAGLSWGNIIFSNACTNHNPSVLFSHRASKGRRGNLGGFIVLK